VIDNHLMIFYNSIILRYMNFHNSTILLYYSSSVQKLEIIIIAQELFIDLTFSDNLS
jgi:hypothetical protein